MQLFFKFFKKKFFSKNNFFILKRINKKLAGKQNFAGNKITRIFVIARFFARRSENGSFWGTKKHEN